jgi:hypothetical protein
MIVLRRFVVGVATFAIGLAGGYLGSKAWVELA